MLVFLGGLDSRLSDLERCHCQLLLRPERYSACILLNLIFVVSPCGETDQLDTGSWIAAPGFVFAYGVMAGITLAV
jgi:hypothetical protein